MAVGLSATVANAIGNALTRNVAWTQPAAVWIKLHTGDPGAAGANNAAGETTRKQATFSAWASGASSNSAALDWTSVSTSETYTRYSAWDASVAGNFLFSGNLTANAVTAGDNFSIAIAALTANLTIIAA